MNRRRATALLAALPAAAALPALADPPAAEAPKATPLGAFLSGQAPGLSGEEKAMVVRDVATLEKSLKVVRDFALPNDVAPAFRFRPVRSGARK